MPKRKDDNGNGKVTNAILSTKLDHISKLAEQIPDIRDRLARSEQERKDFGRRIDSLETKSNAWNFANSLGGLILTAWVAVSKR